MGGNRGRLVSSKDRLQAIELISEACKSGARKAKACELLNLSMRTVIRWEQQNNLADKRKTSSRLAPANKLTQDEREMILEAANVSPSNIKVKAKIGLDR